MKPLSCRIKQVRLFTAEDLLHKVDPEYMFSEQYLWYQLYERALLVLFVDRNDSRGLCTVVTQTVAHLNNVLRVAYTNNRGRGGFEPVRRAYQAELALEKLVYGHPLSPYDHQLTQVLGTSGSHEKSLSLKMRGFLGLEPWNTATTEVCCPPLANWTKDRNNVLCINRIFQLAKTLGAAPSAVGQQLWMVLLGDLLDFIKNNLNMNHKTTIT